MRFGEASAVSGGPGRWTGDLADGWDHLGIINGGYAMTLATRAMEAETSGRILVSATGTFVNRSTPGPVTIDVEKLKEGTSMTTLRANVSRDGRNLFHVTGVFAASLGDITARDVMAGDPPDLPRPEDCVRIEPVEGEPLPPNFMGNVELRLHPEDVGAFMGEYPAVPSFRGWFRLLDEEALSMHSVVLAADAYPPAIINSDFGSGWTPTIELSVQVREARPTGWLAGRFTTRFVTGGILEEDGELWDEAGRLVALSRQLALAPR